MSEPRTPAPGAEDPGRGADIDPQQEGCMTTDMTGGFVDVHTHYLPHALIDALAARRELPRITDTPAGRVIEYGEGNVHPFLPTMSDLDLRLADMDRQGIAVAILGVNVPGVDWFPLADGPAVAREVNDELADVVAAHPERLAAMAALPLQAPEAAGAELERAAAAGFVGAMIYSNAAGRPLDDPRWGGVGHGRPAGPADLHPPHVPAEREHGGRLRADPHPGIPVRHHDRGPAAAPRRAVRAPPSLQARGGPLREPDPQLAGRIDYEAERAPNGRGGSAARPASPSASCTPTPCACGRRPCARRWSCWGPSG